MFIKSFKSLLKDKITITIPMENKLNNNNIINNSLKPGFTVFSYLNNKIPYWVKLLFILLLLSLLVIKLLGFNISRLNILLPGQCPLPAELDNCCSGHCPKLRREGAIAPSLYPQNCTRQLSRVWALPRPQVAVAVVCRNNCRGSWSLCPGSGVVC